MNVRAGRRCHRHEGTGIGRAHDVGDLRGVEQRVDRQCRTRRLSAPQRVVVFQAVGQNDRHGTVGTHARVAEQVGGLDDTVEQLAVGDRRGGSAHGPVRKVGDGRTIEMPRGCIAQHGER